MKIDSEKWALSFYGVVDDRLAIETDLFNLHIYRKDGINKLISERTPGHLDIYIPNEWDMELYNNQERIRKLMCKEISWQALNIFKHRTELYAKRFDIAYGQVEVVWKPHFLGHCSDGIKYNMWTICGADKKHIDYLVCHELAHFRILGHNEQFWKKVEQIYNGLDSDKSLTGKSMKLLHSEFAQINTYHVLMYWCRPSYLRLFFERELVQNRTPLITPHYIDGPKGKIQVVFFTNFEIKFWR